MGRCRLEGVYQDVYGVSSMTKAPEIRVLTSVAGEVGRLGTPIGQRGVGFRFVPLTATSQLVITSLYMQNPGQLNEDLE